MKQNIFLNLGIMAVDCGISYCICNDNIPTFQGIFVQSFTKIDHTVDYYKEHAYTLHFLYVLINIEFQFNV